MTQVINNIIINADQSMPEGGIMSINCENVTVGAEKTVPLKEGEYIRISIKDQGIGISEEHISRVFDPYFTTKQKGSGLGLSTSYSIIKRHDGHIDVESELGVGTVFNIYLPASMKKVIDKVLLKDKPITSEGKVLIMDDEELVRDSLGRMIESIGYSTEFASDGKEAVEIYRKTKAESRPFDVVIMDMTIPGGMGGKEAIQELRVIDPNVKAIVSSGYSYDPIMANFKDYGFKAVLSKPYKGIMELSQILDNVIKGRT
jgi:CheY-like chemotaxis protein/anti-sigma regulatory factor (Ser/Thr protein kinase)